MNITITPGVIFADAEEIMLINLLRIILLIGFTIYFAIKLTPDRRFRIGDYEDPLAEEVLTQDVILQLAGWELPAKDMRYTNLQPFNFVNLSRANIAIIGPERTGKTLLKERMIKDCMTRFATPCNYDELCDSAHSINGCVYECTVLSSHVLRTINFDYIFVHAPLLLNKCPQNYAWVVLNRDGMIARFD